MHPHNAHYSQKNHWNANCNDLSYYNDIIAPLDKLIMLHIVIIDMAIKSVDSTFSENLIGKTCIACGALPALY